MSLLALLLMALSGQNQSLGERALAALREAAPRARLEVDTSRLSAVTAPEGSDRSCLRRLSQGRPGGTELFEVRWLAGEVLIGRRQFTLRVRRFDTVATACSTLTRGQILTASQVCAREMPAVGIGERAVSSDSAVGMRARRDISKGRTLLQGELERVPAVLRGQPVRLFAAFGTAQVETSAIALNDAAVGHSVRVRAATGREVVGRVEPDASVRVVPGLH
jgi:flagella basal body P-ring formation protein FlgA